MSGSAFLDSNIFIYAASVDEPDKSVIAEKLISRRYSISAQVVFECLNVLLRKLRFGPSLSIEIVREFISRCEVVPETSDTVLLALQLYERYSFQPYDAKIVASALRAGCVTLYSEDI